MSRHRSTRPGSVAGAFLFALAVVLACGSLAAWTPAPDGLIGFTAVAVVLLGWVGGGGRGRRSGRGRPRARRRRYR